MPAHKLPLKNFVWTSNLAYAVGLLATDGTLSKDKRHIAFRSSELQQIDNFKKCLKIDNSITETRNNGPNDKPSYIIQFGNIQLYNWLLTIGLFPAKSYTIGELKIPDEYFRDFLRGHIDGDGSIWTYQDKWNAFKNPEYIYTRLWVRFLSASEKHIKWIQTKITQMQDIKGHLWERKPSHPDQTTSMWEVKFAKKDSIKLLSWLYYSPDVPCLARKRAIAEKFI